MRHKKRFWWVLVLLAGMGCDGQKSVYPSPAEYDLGKPEKYEMPGVLHEISGIAFNKGMGDTLYAEEDEEGKLFHFHPGSEKLSVTKFAKRGDYEDLAISQGTVILLRSDGVLFSFPLAEAGQDKVEDTRVWEGLLPAGEYEGLAAVEGSGLLAVLCKHCGESKENKESKDGKKTKEGKEDKEAHKAGGWLFTLDASGEIRRSGEFTLDLKQIESASGVRKMKFHPSALAWNPLESAWYILSSVNKLLVITDASWNVKDAYPLNPSLFTQPEGIAFTANGDLYISNERNESAHATVLKFARHPAAK